MSAVQASLWAQASRCAETVAARRKRLAHLLRPLELGDASWSTAAAARHRVFASCNANRRKRRLAHALTATHRVPSMGRLAPRTSRRTLAMPHLLGVRARGGAR